MVIQQINLCDNDKLVLCVITWYMYILIIFMGHYVDALGTL